MKTSGPESVLAKLVGLTMRSLPGDLETCASIQLAAATLAWTVRSAFLMLALQGLQGSPDFELTLLQHWTSQRL